MDESTKLIAPPVPTEWDMKQLTSCDNSVRFRRLIELALCRKVVDDLIAAGYVITVDDGDDEPVRRCADSAAVMDAIFAVDECTLIVCDAKHKSGWIRIILGNTGWDSISDYTVNLEVVLTPSNEYAEQLAEWM